MSAPKTSRQPQPNGRPVPSGRHVPSSEDELTQQNVDAIVKLEEAARQERSLSDRIADAVARFCGSMTFMWTHVVWFGGWIVFNVMPSFHHFDPFPFTFLTLVVSLEAIFLSTFIMISQNLQAQKDRVRTELDYQVAMKVQLEIMQLHQKVDRLPEELMARLGLVDRSEPGFPQPGFPEPALS